MKRFIKEYIKDFYIIWILMALIMTGVDIYKCIRWLYYNFKE